MMVEDDDTPPYPSPKRSPFLPVYFYEREGHPPIHGNARVPYTL
jgi:hypothetical protein